MQTFSFKDFFYSWIILFVVWLGFTATLNIYEVVTGLVITLVIAYYTFRNYSHKGVHVLFRFFHAVKYLFVFLKALVVANFDVARRVVSPALPINPGIVKFKTQLQSDFGKMVLANSITLTPGTLTVDMIDDTFYIHWIDVTTTDPEKTFVEIAKEFEDILIKIFDK
jgi:multicomponent Na+:H+ antiporter subunit E